VGYKSKEVLNTIAKTAADAYIKKGSTMTEYLKKTASQEGLEPHQVEYVAGEANKMVWSHNYNKHDKQAAYDFPLANPNEIIQSAQKKPVEKVAEASLDYMLPPTARHTKMASDAQVYGEFKSEVTSQDERRALKHQLQSRYEKLAQAKESTSAEILMAESRIDFLEKKFVKEARVFIMETPFSDRPQAMDKIAEFIRSTGHFEQGRNLIAKLAHKIVRDGLVKEADMKAPEAYISETLPARIINGNHSLYITIDTIVKQHDELSNMRRNFTIVDDTLPVLKEKIRGL
jgi:hypothetical protein